MLVCNPYEVVIHGTTSKGKIFRPSDWAERLCGILSSFTKDNRLSYSNWVRPILVDNVRCVAVDKKLEEDNPQMFRFLMDFAADNDLRVIDCKALLKEQESKQQGEVPVERVLLAQAIEEKHAAERGEAADTQPEPQAAAPVVGVLREIRRKKLRRFCGIKHFAFFFDRYPPFCRTNQRASAQDWLPPVGYF